MKPVWFGRALIVGAVLGCSQPLAPDPLLTGTWDGAEVPSGSYMQLVLTAAGGSVTGTVREYLGPGGTQQSSGTVSGNYTFGVVTLRINDPTGSSGSYAAQLTSTDQLQGTWTSSAGDTTVTWMFTQVAQALGESRR